MGREDETRPDTGVFDKEPAEGSREVVDRELKRQGKDGKAAPAEAGDDKPEAGRPRGKKVMDSTKGLP